MDKKETIFDWLGNDATHALYKIEGSYSPDRAELSDARDYMNGDEGLKVYFSHNVLSYGDYDNSCDVERSNVRTFLKEFKDSPWIYEHSGGYGWHAVWIDIKCDDENIIDTLNALANYPAMDDEDVSNMRDEMENEDWDNWIRDEFKEQIGKKFNSNYDEADEDSLRTLYNQLKKSTSTEYFVQSGGNGWVEVSTLVEAMTTPPPRRIKCDQCNMLSINGMATHETGCPNTHKVYDFDEEEWVTPTDEEEEQDYVDDRDPHDINW